MDPWCSTNDINALVKGSPTTAMLEYYASLSTSLLYTLSGSCFAGVQQVTIIANVRQHGLIYLTSCQPVINIISLTIDDEETEYTLSTGKTYLIVDRTCIGKQSVITLNAGQSPPISGRHAAAALAAEMIRGDPEYATIEGASDTRPPFRVTSIARQGVTYTYSDLSDSTRESLTGIYEVDLFLNAVNPIKVRRQSRVIVP